MDWLLNRFHTFEIMLGLQDLGGIRFCNSAKQEPRTDFKAYGAGLLLHVPTLPYGERERERPAFPESACPLSTALAGPEYSQLGKAPLPCRVTSKWRAHFNLPLFPRRGGHPWTVHQSQPFECQRRHLSPQGHWESVGKVTQDGACDQGQDPNYRRRLCHPSRCIPPASFPRSQTCKGCDCPPGTQRRRGDRERGGGNAFSAYV